MLKKLLFITVLLASFGSYAQGLKVLITEKKKGKRIVLVAENKTTDTLNVFLMVNAQGYRKSASKPVIKNIPPKAKVPMITLIELSGEESTYTYDLIVNEEELDINISHDNQVKDIERTIDGRLVLFSADGCEKCTVLSDSLTKRRIDHRVFNINENPVVYRQFMAFIERKLTSETKIRFPVIWNKDEAVFGYDDLEKTISELAKQ
ncbi:hypothetical protein G5B37_05325 [Rasiella rasia]|uniref:Glutaredoxin domain-containing protein n=1 Tax=Rasiella rasia TaxID=2744027 RepID=A0A6G6GKC0_9FLAO|nr:hypothetical protein [Rasiella rasia]QIE59002.1 hypothetical protein G5B37_05325 [Rasiella rasia]